MKKYIIKRVASGKLFNISLGENNLNITTDGNTLYFHYNLHDSALNIESINFPISQEIFYVAAEILFNEYSNVTKINLNNQKNCLRETFYQLPSIWNIPTDANFPLECWTQTKDVRHPRRPEFKAGQELYHRYVSTIDATVTFRVIALSDLEIFHEWHNQPRVANFWELAKPREELLSYIKKGLNDPHQVPVIAEINGIPVGYFELYWTKEDRLGPYYESEAYDRGFHLLIGNINFLGFNNTDALLKSFTHFIFLDDPRTRKIMGEPRHDNQKILKYVLSFKSWRKIKEFDFPHKRAVLLECNRELFFQGYYL